MRRQSADVTSRDAARRGAAGGAERALHLRGARDAGDRRVAPSHASPARPPIFPPRAYNPSRRGATATHTRTDTAIRTYSASRPQPLRDRSGGEQEMNRLRILKAALVAAWVVGMLLLFGAGDGFFSSTAAPDGQKKQPQ